MRRRKDVALSLFPSVVVLEVCRDRVSSQRLTYLLPYLGTKRKVGDVAKCERFKDGMSFATSLPCFGP